MIENNGRPQSPKSKVKVNSLGLVRSLAAARAPSPSPETLPVRGADARQLLIQYDGRRNDARGVRCEGDVQHSAVATVRQHEGIHASRTGGVWSCDCRLRWPQLHASVVFRLHWRSPVHAGMLRGEIRHQQEVAEIVVVAVDASVGWSGDSQRSALLLHAERDESGFLFYRWTERCYQAAR